MIDQIPSEDQSPRKVNFDIQVHTFQIDYMRHVNNIAYVQWMEIGRCALLDAVGLPVVEIAQQGIFPVLVETSIRYKKPVFLGDSVRGETWVSELSMIWA